jgi:acyl phosphate:glycerol-3-phosphate acyltransferase
MTGSEHGDLLVPLALAAVAGYLLGALPFGYLVARSRGVNIFEVGSKSPGATNVGRVLGKWPRNLVFALDALKGAAAAGWPLLAVWGAVRAFDVPSLLGFVGLGFALVGHSFSCFTHFKGGKGVSTAAGGLMVLMPPVAVVSGVVWLCVFFATRYVSLASILGAMSLPVTAVLTHRGALSLWVTGFVALFVLVMHRTNIGRLLSGTEKRFEKRRDGDGKGPGGKP